MSRDCARMLALLLLCARLIRAAEQPNAESVSQPAAVGNHLLLVAPRTIAIIGICRDEADQPLADVRVALYRIDCFPAIRRVLLEETRSSAKGHYRFTNVARASVREDAQRNLAVLFRKDGCASELVAIESLERDHERNVNMSVAARLNGRVTDPDGNPVEGAWVFNKGLGAEEPLEEFQSARTDANGRFMIDDYGVWSEKRIGRLRAHLGEMGCRIRMKYPLRVRHPDYAGQLITFEEVPATFDITLACGGIVEGRVIDGVTGKSAANVAVVLRAMPPGDPPLHPAAENDNEDREQRVFQELGQIRHLPGTGENIRRTETDERGYYRFTGVTEARYLIYAAAADRNVCRIAIDSRSHAKDRTGARFAFDLRWLDRRPRA